MTWRCPSCGPLRDQPLHGADEQYHCTGLECDAVVTFDRMPPEPKKERGFTFDPTPKPVKVSPAESRRRTNEGKAILARRYITKNATKIKALAETIAAGDKSTFANYDALIGPVPTE